MVECKQIEALSRADEEVVESTVEKFCRYSDRAPENSRTLLAVCRANALLAVSDMGPAIGSDPALRRTYLEAACYRLCIEWMQREQRRERGVSYESSREELRMLSAETLIAQALGIGDEE